MRPLLVCTDKSTPRRRSKRPTRDRENRTKRIELRVEPHELAKWIRVAQQDNYLGLSDFIRQVCNSAAKNRKHTSSEDDSWNTPQIVLDTIKPLGVIGLDPCSNAGSIVRARENWILPKHDGLALAWTRYHYAARRGFVYVNPPYGLQIIRWIRKCIEMARRGVEIVTLVPARVDTEWFEELQTAADVGLWRGRLTFLRAPYPALFPSALGYFGPRRELFRRAIAPRCVRVLEAAAPAFRLLRAVRG